MNFLELLDWKLLLITATITAFVVSALATITQVSVNKLVFIVALLVTLLSTQFEGACAWDWQKLALQILMTMAFAVLFYNYIGKWFIDDLFAWLKKLIGDKFNKDNPPPAAQ